MLRSGRPWTIGIFIDLFFCTGSFQQKARNLLSLIIEEKQFSQLWEQTWGTLQQQRRRRACGTAARDSSKPSSSSGSLGYLNPCQSLPAHGSEPHKWDSRFAWAGVRNSPILFAQRKGGAVLIISSQGKGNVERGELPTPLCAFTHHTSCVLHWLQSAAVWADCCYCSDLISL